MPRPKQTEDGLTKLQRYRLQQRHRGMKQLRIWAQRLPTEARDPA